MANNLLMLVKLDADTMAFISLLVSVVGALAAIFAAFYANIAAFYAKRAASRRDLAPVQQSTPPVEQFNNRILSINTQIPPPPQREASQPQPQQEPPQLQVQREASRAQPPQEAPQLYLQREPPSQPQPQPKAPQPQAPRETPQAQPQREAPQPQTPRISISVEGEAMGEVPLELLLTLQESSIRVSRVETLNEARKPLSSSPAKATDNALVFKSILTPKKMRQWWSAGELTNEAGGRGVLRVYLLVDESRKEVYRDIPVSIAEELRSVGIASLVVWTVKGSI